MTLAQCDLFPTASRASLLECRSNMGGPQDETELVERSRRGDLEAFNEIVAAYQDQVYNLCLRMLGSRQPAEDVAQETFLSAFRNVGRMRAPHRHLGVSQAAKGA